MKLGEQPWTIRQFQERASEIIKEIRASGKVPILVGGTHYYTQSLLFNDALLKEDDASNTEAGQKEVEIWPTLEPSTQEMMEDLWKVDPAMANRWHPNDRRKIRRSLEIWLKTGNKASDLYEEQRQRKNGNEAKDSTEIGNQHDSVESNIQGPTQAPLRYDSLVFWTYAASDVLNARLDKRVDSMISDGLLEEVGSMHEFFVDEERKRNVVDQSRGIWVAIGFKEFLPYIHNDGANESLAKEGVERTKIATRQYAKRQNRWIRLKLLRALKEANQDRSLYLLEATDLAQWSENVEKRATEITAAFLKRVPLPEARSLSDAANELLVPDEGEVRSARYCELCDKTLMSEPEWLKHLKAKGHRSASRPKIDWRALYPKDKPK